jgi:2TM domain
MPPRWSRVPTRQDADFRKLDDRMTFATHVAAFIAGNSGVWFFRLLQRADWGWTVWMTAGWSVLLGIHAVYIFAIAGYNDSPSSDTPSDPSKT